MREITYSQNGEYQIPDISLEETRGTIGKYGLMRKEYLRNHKVARFNILTLQNRLDSHLMEIDSQARQRVDNLMSELLEKNPAPDKMADGMAWTRHMNQIKAQAEELVIQEIIYSLPWIPPFTSAFSAAFSFSKRASLRSAFSITAVFLSQN